MDGSLVNLYDPPAGCALIDDRNDITLEDRNPKQRQPPSPLNANVRLRPATVAAFVDAIAQDRVANDKSNDD